MPYVSPFYPGERIFDDTVGATDELARITLTTGCIPRDYKKDPIRVSAGNEVPLIPRAEWDDRLEEQAKTKSRLSDIRMTGNFGKMIPSLNQGSFGFCWNHSGTAGGQIIRAVMGLPYVPLSAFAACAIINDFKDGGGWGSAGLEFAIKRGYPPQSHWPQGSISRQHDNPETWAEAKKYQVIEGVIDLDGMIPWQNLAFEAVASLLLSRIPVITDFMWWGHSVLALDLVKLPDGGYGIRILNSWGDSWESNGMAVLTGQKAIPNGAVAPRVLTAA
jgi:hypothetical protein